MRHEARARRLGAGRLTALLGMLGLPVACGELHPLVESGGAGGAATGGSTNAGGATQAHGGAGGATTAATGGSTHAGGAVTQARGGAGGSGGAPTTGGAGGNADAASPDAARGTSPPTALIGTPLTFSPTASGIGLNAVAVDGDPALLTARVRASGTTAWSEPVAATARGTDVAQWWLDGLAPGVRYEFEVSTANEAGRRPLYTGSAVTQRPPGEPFTFALITDSHIGANLNFSNQGDPKVLAAIGAEVHTAAPDFILHLGDMLDFHEYGFNDPPPYPSTTRAAYLNYRTLLGDALGHAAHFLTIGNWEGENGTYTNEEIERSLSQRLLYVPGPTPTTYPESGSPNQDYYAFTWGDALFVVLNVMTYTKTEHLLSTNPGLPDDWTLGAEQLAWLETTLAKATSTWRFLLVHHTVGGAAGDEYNSAYGRGGGQAAYVGEQAKVHALMLEHGVRIFFYGHDHVFAETVVDGIHYTLPGNSGAIWMFTPTETGYAQSWLEYGFGHVMVSPEQVHVELRKLGGEVLHAYTLP